MMEERKRNIPKGKKSINKIKRLCQTCGITIYLWPCDIKNGMGKFCSKSCIRRTDSFKKWFSERRKNNNNPHWKGDNAGIESIHIWVRNRLKKTKLCQDCKLVPPYDLANISQDYKRDIKDWEWLCRRCHMLKDGRLAVFINISKSKKTHEEKRILPNKKRIQKTNG